MVEPGLVAKALPKVAAYLTPERLLADHFRVFAAIGLAPTHPPAEAALGVAERIRNRADHLPFGFLSVLLFDKH
jgi:hypothetical protein